MPVYLCNICLTWYPKVDIRHILHPPEPGQLDLLKHVVGVSVVAGGYLLGKPLEKSVIKKMLKLPPPWSCLSFLQPPVVHEEVVEHVEGVAGYVHLICLCVSGHSKTNESLI